ncbi:hypothetical protein BDY19DRAFT_1077254 [Irpex rosettiformis]|uniref:Uncharacterized protein n=1 Tax=Irpex rosettiformis TaxID=378272 RepID=A0ACB8TRW3_9APHY|nr:hypothetical protein BDY19DRAFT_1077254 [Irpex rosettiformis]
MDSGVCTESSSLRFEWTLRGLGELFENSKGETKAKVTKSPRFGGGRWQVLFYANSGTVNSEGVGYISLYLSCEPTGEEKETAVDGKWVRKGVYKFGFELRNFQKTILFNTKEAPDHSFSYNTVNWGWAQFARRDAVYYQSSSVRQQDAFMIICTITSSPAPPAPLPAIQRQLVPKILLEAMGGLLDDPNYSDVEFIIPRRRGKSGTRKIYAAKKLLKRVEYFDTMFRAGFAEGIQMDTVSSDVDSGSSDDTNTSVTLYGKDSNEDVGYAVRFEDSDDEDDDEDSVLDPQIHLRLPDVHKRPRPSRPTSWASVDQAASMTSDEGSESEGRNVKVKLSHPSSPRAEANAIEEELLGPVTPVIEETVPGPKKVKVIIRDVAYSTYRAVLNYIYTDTIAFAPLASTFHIHHLQADTSETNTPTYGKLHGHLGSSLSLSTPAAPAAEGQTLPLTTPKAPQSGDANALIPQFPSRKAWIADWEKKNPNRPRPCSAKAVYRLADKLDLQELKERAFQHIVKSLTVDNVAYEVFSDFSAAFEDVRKIEVAFFLKHWSEIRGSEAMRNVWQQIRLGRHPGFEEVWPLIALNLEFKPNSPISRNIMEVEVTK